MKTRITTILAFMFFLFLGVSCDKEDDVTCVQDCLETYLEQNEMVPYQGEDPGCKFYLTLYEYKRKQYYVLGNHCADMVVYPTDCNGNKLCEAAGDATCADFYENAKYIGIVGIQK
ncbi:DUF6970 domain-containing protein [Pontibacter akesuensis]|uniref:DUF6970 domain-containing protein n=1 Tax=Pontibacter akesuensis TaxID=388950 RepID=A0A1I7KFL9_9BACT|nr:hypothetical protein [Pontibacter akesuensis]GHA79527.1 hypothetical protein GCM10007389_37140 [Pontibacter akesuensis]SFU96247.1 hypothetical protein SAMN04487941_3674 [Pontibacter akesuensis]